MRDRIKAILAWILAAIVWLADRLYGDAIFNWISPMIPDAIASPSLDGIIWWGKTLIPPIALISLGIFFFNRGGRNAKANKELNRFFSPTITQIPASSAGRQNEIPIRELFLHIDPDVLEDIGASPKPWEKVGQDVSDALSLGKLDALGREIKGSRRLALAPIQPDYWRDASFTYWFMSKDAGEREAHVRSPKGEYADVRVNREQAFKIWPEADRGNRYMALIDAARRAYSETRKSQAAAWAEAFGETPDGILQHYCFLIVDKFGMPLRGVREPSNTDEAIDWDNTKLELVTKGRGVIAKERNGKGVFTNLMVRRDQLPGIIGKIRTWAE